MRARTFESAGTAFIEGLRDLLEDGRVVPSVTGPFSKASNFGAGDRPWLELIAYGFEMHNHEPTVLGASVIPNHEAYTIGLLAWTLDGRDDLETLAYYRPAAAEFSDDGFSMCGAFGHRMQSRRAAGNQFEAVMGRLLADPASRRTFIPIIEPTDNLAESREYPCAAGVQMFRRDESLHWLTVMRAQQALTVLPYDASLFSMMHHFVAAELDLEVGSYSHFSGTFHIYESEVEAARRQVAAPPIVHSLPRIPRGEGRAAAAELISIEKALRAAGAARQVTERHNALVVGAKYRFCREAGGILLDFARQK